MSKICTTICDGCRKEITGALFEPNLCLTVVFNETKLVTHYCYNCGARIVESINNIIKDEKRKRTLEKKGNKNE